MSRSVVDELTTPLSAEMKGKRKKGRRKKGVLTGRLAGSEDARTVARLRSLIPASEPNEQLLLNRLVSSLVELVQGVSARAVRESLEASGPVSSLSILLDNFLQEHADALPQDGMASRHHQLTKARRSLLEKADGVYSTREVAELFGTSADAVRKRLQRGTLLSFRTPSGEHRLPKAQFSGTDTLDGLDEVLAAMHVSSDWMRIQLFLDDDVLGALKEGRVDDAVRAVRSYLPMDEGSEE